MSDNPWDEKKSDDGLGSLAQSARHTSLKQARAILIVIGGLNLLAGMLMFALAEDLVRRAIEAEKQKAGPGVVFDPEKIRAAEAELLRVNQIVFAGVACLGAIFIGLGLAVYKAPVACTVTGLVLYLSANAAAAVFDPSNLANPCAGAIKILIIVGLIKAVQAAIAYERERKAERQAARRTSRDEYADDVEVE